MTTRNLASPARAAGFTLTEIMIALLIGMLGILVMMQTFSVSEGFKRTATSGTDAQINGAVALYLLERELRVAGYGLNALVPAGCSTVRIWNSDTGSGRDMRFAPLEINPPGIPPGDPNTDVVLITYGSTDNVASGVPADQPGGLNTANFRVRWNRDGFRNGDVVVALQPVAGGGISCVLHEITAVPNIANNCNAAPPPFPNELVHGTGKYKHAYQGCQEVVPRMNAAGGIRDGAGNPIPALVAATGGRLYNLGPGVSLQAKAYAVRNRSLTTCNLLTTNCNDPAQWALAVNDVVSLKAVYGKDLDGNPNPGTPRGDGIVDAWSRGPVNNSNQASRILSASVGIVARSGLKEKDCNTTVDPARPDRTMEWFGPALTPNDGTLAPARMNIATSDAEWGCYRYKLFQTTVPLRNMIWRFLP